MCRELSIGCGGGSRPSLRSAGTIFSIPLVWQNRQRVEFDPFLREILGFLGRGHAVDGAVLNLTVVHLARFLGEFCADIVGILCELLAQLLQLGAEFSLPRREHGYWRRRRYWCFGNGRRRLEFLCSRGQPRRHDRLLDLGRAALRACDQLALGLLVVSGRIRKPTFELMAVVADQGIFDHCGLRTTCRWVGSAIGSTISKRRPCCNEGMRARAL